MAADRDIECAGPAVFRRRAALEERERPTVGVDAADPDVKRSVPVTVAVNVAPALGLTGGRAVRVEDGEQLVLRIGRSRRCRSESFEDVLEGAVGDELLGELVPARSHLALNDAVLGEPVLADPVEPRRVDVNRHGGQAVVMVDPMDVAGAALAGRSPRPADGTVARRRTP